MTRRCSYLTSCTSFEYTVKILNSTSASSLPNMRYKHTQSVQKRMICAGIGAWTAERSQLQLNTWNVSVVDLIHWLSASLQGLGLLERSVSSNMKEYESRPSFVSWLRADGQRLQHDTPRRHSGVIAPCTLLACLQRVATSPPQKSPFTFPPANWSFLHSDQGSWAQTSLVAPVQFTLWTPLMIAS